MSKKSRRQRTPNLPPEAFSAPQATSVTTSVKGASPASAATATAKPVAHANGVNWQAEYGDVLGDLKRTATIAVILLVGMVLLSFVIQ